MTEPRIRLDSTRESIVIRCADCPHWYGFAFGRVSAWRRAAAHEALCHPSSRNARQALLMALKAAGLPPEVVE